MSELDEKSTFGGVIINAHCSQWQDEKIWIIHHFTSLFLYLFYLVNFAQINSNNEPLENMNKTQSTTTSCEVNALN